MLENWLTDGERKALYSGAALGGLIGFCGGLVAMLLINKAIHKSLK